MIDRGTWSAISLIAFLTAGGVALVPRAACAQPADVTRSPSLEDLKRQLAAIERDTAAQIAAVRQQIAALESARPGSAAVPQPAGPPAPSAQETFARDRETVARVDNAPLDPALQGFVPIPGRPS